VAAFTASNFRKKVLRVSTESRRFVRAWS